MSGMLQARPSEKDFDAVWDFLSGLDELLGDLEDDEDQEIGEWIRARWDDVRGSYTRLLFAGKVAIDNACDPNVGHLEYKPEIKRAIECHDELLAACKAMVEWFDRENSGEGHSGQGAHWITVAACQKAEDMARAAVAKAEAQS